MILFINSWVSTKLLKSKIFKNGNLLRWFFVSGCECFRLMIEWNISNDMILICTMYVYIRINKMFNFDNLGVIIWNKLIKQKDSFWMLLMIHWRLENG